MHVHAPWGSWPGPWFADMPGTRTPADLLVRGYARNQDPSRPPDSWTCQKPGPQPTSWFADMPGTRTPADLLIPGRVKNQDLSRPPGPWMCQEPGPQDDLLAPGCAKTQDLSRPQQLGPGSWTRNQDLKVDPRLQASWDVRNQDQARKSLSPESFRSQLPLLVDVCGSLYDRGRVDPQHLTSDQS